MSDPENPCTPDSDANAPGPVLHRRHSLVPSGERGRGRGVELLRAVIARTTGRLDRRAQRTFSTSGCSRCRGDQAAAGALSGGREVAALRLEDIGWRAGEITVHIKGRRCARLPLPADVGDAIAAYERPS